MARKPASPPRFKSQVQAILAAEVRVRLDETNIRQRDLAHELGISEKHLSQMLTGRSQGTLEMWDRLLTSVTDYQKEQA